MEPEKAKALKEQFSQFPPDQQENTLKVLKLMEKHKLIEPASHLYEPQAEKPSLK